MTLQSASRNRLHELDALRGIAALMVVLYHYTVRFGEIYGRHLSPAWDFESGKYGVHLFFMISGFVIFMTLGRVTQASDFVMARFARLFPAYWVAVLLTSAVVFAAGLPGREYPWWVTLLNLTMLQTWLGIPHVDGVYWTLSLELAFYGWIWLALVSGQIQRLWVGCYVAVLGVFMLGLAEQEGWFRLYWPFRPVLLIGHAHLFVAGMAFFRLYREGWRQVPSAWVLIAMAMATECVLGTRESAGVALICILIFCALISQRLQPLARQPLLYLGAISYSLYLVHQNLGYVVIRALQSAAVHEPWLLIGVPLLVSLLVAHAVHTWVEEPLSQKIRSMWQAKQ